MPIRSLNAHFLSRDNFLVLGTLVLLVIGTIVVLGTSMPVISAIPGVGHTLQDIFGSTFEINDGSAMTGQPLEDGRFNLAPSFYETTTPILALVMMVLLVFAPLLGWHEANPRTLLRTMRWPFVAAVVSTIIAIILGVRQGMSLAFILVSILAMGTNILTIVRTVRGGGGWLFVGGQVAHVGLCLLILGVIGSKVYASPDERVIISTDETVSIYGFDLTFQGWEATQDGEGNPDGKGVLNLTISRGGSNFTARPEIYFDQTMGGVMQTPSVHSRLWYDLYVSPVEYMGENDPNRPFLEAGETVSAGPYDLTFQGYSIDEDTIGQDGKAKLNAELTVAYEGSETTVMPQIEIDVGEEDEETTFREIPTTLPGGHTISTAMEELNSSQRMSMLTQRMAILNIEGLDLPIQPAQAVLTVSTKPLMILVWAGVIICLLGGGIAAFRRHIEGQLRLGRTVRVPVPPGMAEQV
jgi:cytochrome c-type biogenesis protein CcmF